MWLLPGSGREGQKVKGKILFTAILCGTRLLPISLVRGLRGEIEQ